jgi:glycosyltransferase involved in cell wall biosynthesis
MSLGRSPAASYDVMFYLPSVTPLLTQGAGRSVGGAETQIVLLSRALARRGVRVCLVAFPPSDGELPPSLDGVDIVVRPVYKAHQRLVGKLREAARIRRTIAQVDVPVVVARVAGPQVGLVAVSSKLLRRSFAYSSAAFFDFDFGAIGLKRRDLALYRLGLRLATEVVVQTAEQAELCRTKLGRSPILIKSIVEPAAQRTAPPKAFLWIGRVDSNKQPLAFVELARSLPNSLFWMVPIPSAREKRLMEAVESAAADLPNVQLLAPRPRNELMYLLDQAVAVVSTSDFEGMPNVFLEAWTRGVPALALSHDPDRVIERHGLGEFARGSRERLVAGATRLWDDRHDQRELAERCRRYVSEEHSEGVVAGQWERALGLSASVPPGSVLEQVA